MQLKDLEIGDVFYPVKDKKKSKYIKRGVCMFNRGAGTSTCACLQLGDNTIVNKQCRLEVIKLRDSDHKDKYQANPLNTIHHAYNK